MAVRPGRTETSVNTHVVFSIVCDFLNGVAITSVTGHVGLPSTNISNTLPSSNTIYVVSAI